jgi:hypothetical protein
VVLAVSGALFARAARQARCRDGKLPTVAVPASTQAIAGRIGYPPAALVPILEDELGRGHVRWTGRGWQLVPSSFAPETLAAIHRLDGAGSGGGSAKKTGADTVRAGDFAAAKGTRAQPQFAGSLPVVPPIRLDAASIAVSAWQPGGRGRSCLPSPSGCYPFGPRCRDRVPLPRRLKPICPVCFVLVCSRGSAASAASADAKDATARPIPPRPGQLRRFVGS